MREALACLLLLIAGCMRPPAALVPVPRYVVGEPYVAGGLWSYPREDFGYAETGVAAVLPEARAGSRTVNGEIVDPEALIAAHRTLPLPAIVVVTNLETGRALAVRVNDRGPVQAGRVIGLSRRAAALLGVPAGGAAQVALAIDAAGSAALAAGLPNDRPRPVVATAPRGAVAAEGLAPLPGSRTAGGIALSGTPVTAAEAAAEPGLPPLRLPETIVSQAPAPGRFVVELGSFYRRDLAARQAARIAALAPRVEPVGAGRVPQWRVVAGPYATLAEADRAVAGVLAAGLPEVRLLVER